MLKVLPITTMLFICCGTARAQVTPSRPFVEILPQIIVTSPWHSPAWATGYTTVTWKTIGRMPSAVNISLHPADCSGEGIYLASANPRSGRQVVRIPQRVTERGPHAIRVGKYLASPAGCGALSLHNGMIVTEPNSRTIWHQGESVIVRWSAGDPEFDRYLYILLIPEEQIGRGERWGILEPLASHIATARGEARVTIPSICIPGRWVIGLCGEMLLNFQYGPASDVFRIVVR